MAIAISAGPQHAAVGCSLASLLACFVVIYATPSDGYWTVDCGSKALLAKRLLATGFGELNFDYPAAAYDPQGAAFPIPPPYALPRRGGFVTQYPPPYSAIAVPFLALLGEPGLRVPAALGVAACAFLFTIWTAPAVGRRWAAGGALALTLASPLFFYGTVVWEHSLTVALPLAAWTVLSRVSPRRLVGAGLLTASACWFRTELLVMGLALAVACALHRRRLADPAWLGLGAAPALAGWTAFNLLAFGNALGIHAVHNVGVTRDTASAGIGELLLRAGALLGGRGSDPLEAALLGLGVPVCFAVGMASVRFGRGQGVALALALVTGVWASLTAGVRIVTATIPVFWLVDYNGFLVQMPMIALAGIGCARVWRHSEYAPLRIGVGAGLVFLVLALPLRVTLTEFATAGHWGPRMLLPAAPAIVALALVALHSEAASGVRRARRAFAAATSLGLIGLAATGISVWMLAQTKLEVRRLQRAILARPQTVVVTNHPALGQQLAAIWGLKPLLLVDDQESLLRVGRAIRDRGVGEFLLLHRPPTGRGLGRFGGIDCRLVEQYRGEHVRVLFDLDLQVCTASAER